MKPLIRAMLPAAVMAVLGLPACDSVDAVVNPPPPQVSIRFVNTIVDAKGNILVTADNLPVGTALAFGAAAAMCTAIDTGTTNLAFGTANTFGTGIATSLGTLTHEFSTAGDFTVIATGSAASPQLLVFNDEPVTAPFAIRTTPVATNLTFGTTDDVVFAAPTLLTLTASDVRTVVLAPLATGMTEFQAITVQRC
jgi:hypothetical protein